MCRCGAAWGRWLCRAARLGDERDLVVACDLHLAGLQQHGDHLEADALAVGVGQAVRADLAAGGGAADLQGRAEAARPQHGERLIFAAARSEEHTSELQSLMRLPYAVFC